jgi:hypothetical protein
VYFEELDAGEGETFFGKKDFPFPHTLILFQKLLSYGLWVVQNFTLRFLPVGRHSNRQIKAMNNSILPILDCISLNPCGISVIGGIIVSPHFSRIKTKRFVNSKQL